jgi:hypothetical protein
MLTTHPHCHHRIVRHTHTQPSGTYEAIKALLMHRHPNTSQHPHTLDLLLAGGLAGQLTWLTCYPQDVIKSRMQAEPASTRRGSYYYARELWYSSTHRWRVFFKGFSAAIIRAFPANAATFFVYEQTMQFMYRSHKEHHPDIHSPFQPEYQHMTTE